MKERIFAQDLIQVAENKGRLLVKICPMGYAYIKAIEKADALKVSMGISFLNLLLHIH